MDAPSHWPPKLPEHVQLTRWRRVHPEALAELRRDADLGPVEAAECEARSRDTGRAENVMALRPIASARPAAAPEVVKSEGRRLIERLKGCA